MYRNPVYTANVCRITIRQMDGGPYEVLGSGCLTRSALQGPNLMIATSKKIVQNSKADIKFFAILTDPSGKQHELELGPPDKESLNSEIVYFSVDKSSLSSALGSKVTAFFEGIPESNESQDSFDADSYSVVIRTVQSYDKDEIVARRVVSFDQRSCSVLLAENPEQGFDDLAVQGSPILSFRAGEVEFWGIVYFSEDNKVLLQFKSGACGRHRQETVQPPLEDSKLSTEDKLEKLWEDQYFKDALSKPLDLEYSSVGKKIQNWRHLAQEFEIPNEVRDQIAASMLGPTSPSECLFEYLRSKKPWFTIKQLREIFVEAKVYQVLRLFKDNIEVGIKEKKLKWEDRVSELEDNYPYLMEKIIIKLDSGDFWKRVATALEIPQEKCASFTRDPNFNPTRVLFEILRTQSPDLRISNLKCHLKTLELENMLEQMKEIPANKLLKDLTSEAALMCDVIEPKFNTTENNLLYKLAELFQKDGYLRDVAIKDFGACESQESPTCEVIEYVLTSLPVEYKIKDLIERLVKIDRTDCVDIVKEYLKDAKEVDQIMSNLQQLHLKFGELGGKTAKLPREISYVDDKKDAD